MHYLFYDISLIAKILEENKAWETSFPTLNHTLPQPLVFNKCSTRRSRSTSHFGLLLLFFVWMLVHLLMSNSGATSEYVCLSVEIVVDQGRVG